MTFTDTVFPSFPFDFLSLCALLSGGNVFSIKHITQSVHLLLVNAVIYLLNLWFVCIMDNWLLLSIIIQALTHWWIFCSSFLADTQHQQRISLAHRIHSFQTCLFIFTYYHTAQTILQCAVLYNQSILHICLYICI